jgi:predicted heme/steroid binding protein
MKAVLILAVLVCAAFATRAPMFGKPKFITKEELKQYDGKNEGLPVYLAIKGKVSMKIHLINSCVCEIFDVTAGKKHYGPEGGYGYFSGKDASRAFVSGCFNDDCPDPANLEGIR